MYQGGVCLYMYVAKKYIDNLCMKNMSATNNFIVDTVIFHLTRKNKKFCMIIVILRDNTKVLSDIISPDILSVMNLTSLENVYPRKFNQETFWGIS